MYRSRWKSTIGILAGPIALVLCCWFLLRHDAALAQLSAQWLPDYGAMFKAELAKVGQISPQEFAERYPAPENYLDKISWDPTTAKFWDEFNKPPPEERNPYKIADFRLNAQELALFKMNGFVVSERMGSPSFAEMYYRIYARDLPVFISSDSILHAWHRSYDAILADLETSYLSPALNEIVSGMAERIPAAQRAYGDGLLGDSVRDADYFLAVARSLLEGKQVSTALDQGSRVAETLQAIDRLGMQKFVLFGRERDMDFSQFKVRGHYEHSDELKRYFKAMMWCGRIDLRVAGGKDYFGPLSSARELGSAIVLHDLLRRANGFEQWSQFDRLLQTFVGRTDSATFAHLDRMLKQAGIRSPADLKTADQLEAMQADILNCEFGAQEVSGDLYTSPFAADQQVQLPRSFTLLGQKFVLDSWVTSKVVHDDILWDNKKVPRDMTSCLDVAFAALGNNQVTPLLVDRLAAGPHKARDRMNYQHNLAAARNVIDAHPKSSWDENLYMSWLGSLRELSKPTTEAKYPEALRTRAWGMKALNTQMASWTQLRHDTILYVKQSFSMGGSCYYPAGFVEPVPQFWARLEKMVDSAADHIEKAAYPQRPELKAKQKKQVAFLRHFATQVAILKSITAKQFDQRELSRPETQFLKDVVEIQYVEGCRGGITAYNGWYPGLFYSDRFDSGKWDALVADVHTGQGGVLHQGVGNVDLMLIAIDNGTDRMVYAAPVFSHYEFEIRERMADSEWKQVLNMRQAPPRPEWTRGYLVPGVSGVLGDE